MKNLLPISAIVLALVALGFAVTQKSDVVVGNSAGPEHTEHEYFFAALTGGGIRATSTNDTTATFLDGDLKDVSRIQFTPNVGSITATLPATSTLTEFVPRPGDMRTIVLCNATTTAATPFTLGAGTGMNLVQATSTLTIDKDQCAKLIFSRQADSDIDVFYDLGY